MKLVLEALMFRERQPLQWCETSQTRMQSPRRATISWNCACSSIEFAKKQWLALGTEFWNSAARLFEKRRTVPFILMVGPRRMHAHLGAETLLFKSLRPGPKRRDDLRR